MTFLSSFRISSWATVDDNNIFLFTFLFLIIVDLVLTTVPSPAADRLISTKEEVAVLRKRFEAELARQAKKAADAAAANRKVSTSTTSKARSTKRTEREHAQQRARTIAGSGKGGNQVVEPQDPQAAAAAAIGMKAKGSKKKKRSALANASNPHHLKNYVPSRLPSQGNANQAQVNAQNSIGPLPLRFLSAEIPPRRGKKATAAAPGVVPTPALMQLTNPAEEWVCAFCEYSLFYGDEVGYRRAVRNRKKILKRRRRARERAAAAASGTSTVKVPPSAKDGQEEYEAGYEAGFDEIGTVPKQTKWKGDPNRDRGGGGGEEAGYG